MKPEITKAEAERALGTLRRFGRQGFCKTAEVTAGQCIGRAIYAFNDPSICVDAAMTMLEEWNGHLSVAAIAAIERGQGTVQRQGRNLTITLPQWWQ